MYAAYLQRIFTTKDKTAITNNPKTINNELPARQLLTLTSFTERGQ